MQSQPLLLGTQARARTAASRLGLLVHPATAVVAVDAGGREVAGVAVPGAAARDAARAAGRGRGRRLVAPSPARVWPRLAPRGRRAQARRTHRRGRRCGRRCQLSAAPRHCQRRDSSRSRALRTQCGAAALSGGGAMGRGHVWVGMIQQRTVRVLSGGLPLPIIQGESAPGCAPVPTDIPRPVDRDQFSKRGCRHSATARDLTRQTHSCIRYMR